MGALHRGHSSLMERASSECAAVAVSIFVNPTQFGDDADFDAYPRTPEEDAAEAERAGAGYLFMPSATEMYPQPGLCRVDVDGALAEVLEGRSRPGHFGGVATILAKLLNAAGRCRVYLGEKDYQQLMVVRQMVAEFYPAVEVVGCPTVRESDGLALSSRNGRLGPDERGAATVLWRALDRARALVESGCDNVAEVVEVMEETVGSEPLARLDYAAVVDESSLATPERVPPRARLLIAARVGAVRLIDNVPAGRS